MTKFISHADTNKIIRRVLKEAFPGIKFSVRGSGGGATWIEWNDGPAASQVDALVRRFNGASFDGMTDYKSFNKATMNGEACSFGADFIFTRRTLTQDHIAHFENEWHALPVDVQCTIMNNAPDFSRFEDPARAYANFCGTIAQDSPTAASVRHLSAS